MSVVRAAVVLVAVALIAPACGAGRPVTFSKFAEACGLSVPVPQGFHRDSWSSNGVDGVTVYDGTTGYGNPNQWPLDSNRVLLAVQSESSELPGRGSGVARELRFPIKLGDLERGSGGITFWSGGGSVGTMNSKQDCGVAVWLGSDDSGAHRAAILSALQAVKPN